MAILQNSSITGSLVVSGSGVQVIGGLTGPNISVGNTSIDYISTSSSGSQLVFNKGSVLFDNDINTYKFSTLLKNRSNPVYFAYELERDNFNIGDGANGTIETTSIQSDGKIIIGGIGGSFTSYSGSTANSIARINTDGTLDTTFNAGDGTNSNIYTTSIQSDGKVIIGGYFTSYSGSTANKIARINADGTLDTTFNTGTGFPSTPPNAVRSTAILYDGRVIVGGDFTSYSGSTVKDLARINTDGTLDTTFNVGTGTNGIIRTVSIASQSLELETDNFNIGDGANGSIFTTSIQSDGKVIIGGDFTSYSGSTANRIARINTDGTLDTTFDAGIGPNNDVESTSIQSDGKIIIGGSFPQFNAASTSRIARLNTDGTLDNTFNVGNGANNIVWSISIQSDGKVIIGGLFTSYSGSTANRLARINTDGTLDTTFDTGGGANDSIGNTLIQSDDKVIIGGNFTSYSGSTVNRIARINTDGTLDTTFDAGDGADGYVTEAAIQSDGKVIIGGLFTSYSGSTANKIARINTDGTLDTTFDTGDGLPSLGNSLLSISIQSDDKVIIGGQFTSYSGSTANNMARINTDGTLDTTFNNEDGANSVIRTTSIQSDGKIIIGGSFTSFSSPQLTTQNRITRLTSNGRLDKEFKDNSQIVIGGLFTSYSGSTANRIARINTDGTLDTSFNIGDGANSPIYTTSIQSDDKVIIGGSFTSYSGSTANSIARINTDGTLDTTFDTGGGADNTILTTSIQSDDKVIIGGLFTSYSGSTANRIARINTDGTLDTTFDTGGGADNTILTTSIQSDGKVIIGGNFTSFSSPQPETQNNITRLTFNGYLDRDYKAVSLTAGKSYLVKITGTGPASVSSINMIDFDIHGNALYDVEADTFTLRTPYQLIRGEDDSYTVNLTKTKDTKNILGLDIDGISIPTNLGLDVEIVEVIATGTDQGSGGSGSG